MDKATKTEFKKVHGEFQKVHKEFAKVHKRLDGHDREFQKVHKEFAKVHKQFDSVDKRFIAVDARFDRLENYMLSEFADVRSEMHAGFDNADAKMNKVLDATDKIVKMFQDRELESAAGDAMIVRHDESLRDHESRIVILERA